MKHAQNWQYQHLQHLSCGTVYLAHVSMQGVSLMLYMMQ